MSNGHLRPGLSSWCQARMCCLPACIPGEALPSHSLQAPGREKGLSLFRLKHLGSLPWALNGWALGQTYQLASFPSACSSCPREKVGLMGQEQGVLSGGCGGSVTPLAGNVGPGHGAGTSLAPSSTVIWLLSGDPSIQFSQPCRFFPFQSSLSTYCVHSVFAQREGGEGL